MSRSASRAELGLALALVLAAGGLDLFWVRPAAERWERVSARRGEMPARPAAAGAEVPGVAKGEPAGRDGVDAVPDSVMLASADRRPVEIIEAAQSGRGLVQRQLRMIDRRDEGGVRRTAYAIEVYGRFEDVYGFMEALESRNGQVDVERFRMVTASGDPGVTLFLWASVLTPAV